jgi:hypothetical protein
LRKGTGILKSTVVKQNPPAFVRGKASRIIVKDIQYVHRLKLRKIGCIQNEYLTFAFSCMRFGAARAKAVRPNLPKEQ